jgi:hypothetical protein
MNEVINILQKWQLEANSGHNDGWTQKHYQDKIDGVVSYLVKTPNPVMRGVVKYFEENGEDA